MKKLFLYLVKSQEAVYLPLLILSFVGGYLLATVLFYFFGSALRASLHSFSF